MVVLTIRGCEAVERFCAWFGRVAGWLLIPILLAVALTILAAALGINQFLAWESTVFLFGDAVTVNSLMDLQWYLFSILVLLSGAYALSDNAHVSVDCFSCMFPARCRAVTAIVGDLVFLIPFATVMLYFSWGFAASSFAAGEGSSYGGLMDRWVVKAFLPLGFGLLLLTGVARVVRHTLQLLTHRLPAAAGGAE